MDFKKYIIVFEEGKGREKTVFTDNIEIRDSMVIFTTDRNKIIIPLSRIYKIKTTLGLDKEEMG